MARQWISPRGYVIDENGTEEYLLPSGEVLSENQTGVTAALTGTATASITESDIVTGGKTVILTLTGDTFVTGTTSEDGIAAGSDSAQAEANGWDAVVKTDLDNTDVALSGGNTIATITLPAYATYDITAQETITWTIPAASLTTSSSPIVASPSFTIDAVGVGVTGKSNPLSGPFGGPFAGPIG